VTLQNSFRWARQPQAAGLAVGHLQTGRDPARQPQAAALAVGHLQTDSLGRGSPPDRQPWPWVTSRPWEWARQATGSGWGGSLLRGVGSPSSRGRGVGYVRW
jgi:hypothetical protein